MRQSKLQSMKISKFFKILKKFFQCRIEDGRGGGFKIMRKGFHIYSIGGKNGVKIGKKLIHSILAQFEITDQEWISATK